MRKKELNPEQGKRLIECLKEANLSQKDFAELTGYTPQHINNIVQGKRNMSNEAADTFGDILGVYPSYLLGRRSYKTRDEGHKLYLDKVQEDSIIEHSYWTMHGCCITKVILISEEGNEFSIDPITLFAHHHTLNPNFLGKKLFNNREENIIEMKIYAKEGAGDKEVLIDTNLFFHTLYFLDDYADHLCRTITKNGNYKYYQSQKSPSK